MIWFPPYFAHDICSEDAFSLLKLSSLMTCSMRQASRSAASGATPAAISRSVKKRCFSINLLCYFPSNIGQMQEKAIIHR